MSISGSGAFIKNIRKHPENFYIIHYSCQSLYDDNEALSPRITSIAITHFGTGQTVSFSTHSIAEELHIARDQVFAEFDSIERKLLQDFFAFIRDRRDKYWIHWNMRNLTYGFEHLEHRYRVLDGRDATVIPVERRLNLNDLLADRYGSDYVGHPKMPSLMELNGGIHRHFLDGNQEVESFRNGEFIRMHNSTLCKVGFFMRVVSGMLDASLKTTSRGWGIFIDKLFESRSVKTVGFFGTLITIGVGLWQTALWIGILRS